MESPKDRPLAALIVIPLLVLAACSGAASDGERSSAAVRTAETHVDPSRDERVARGLYLVSAGGCNDCHTPLVMGEEGPMPDTSRLLSGHPDTLELPPAPELPPGPWITTVAATMTAWSGPWGTSFTANLTPDDETGLGRWTEENFIATIRNGRHMGVGRPLLPPMPYQVVANYTDDDLGAIFAYLQSIPPVHNRVHPPIPPTTVSATGASAPSDSSG